MRGFQAGFSSSHVDCDEKGSDMMGLRLAVVLRDNILIHVEFELGVQKYVASETYTVSS